MDNTITEGPQFLDEQIKKCEFLVRLKVCKLIDPLYCEVKIKEVLEAKAPESGKSLQNRKMKILRANESWGNKSLNRGETALVFLSWSSGDLREHPWRGHLVVEKIAGVEYAIFQWPELWAHTEQSPIITQNAIPAPNHENMTAIKYDALKSYLRSKFAIAQDEGFDKREAD